MADFTFPPLRQGVLSSLLDMKEHADADPDFLAAAPYDREALEVLTKLFAPKVVEKIVEKEVVREVKAGRGRPTKDVMLSEEDQQKVRENVAKLIEELDNMGTGEATLETSERIAIVKTKTALNEQLLKMQERIFNVKRMSDFQSIVIGIVNDLVPDDDKHIFLKRIDAYRD